MCKSSYLFTEPGIIAFACQQQLIEIIDSTICQLIQHVHILYA